jgi:hypothetical protein
MGIVDSKLADLSDIHLRAVHSNATNHAIRRAYVSISSTAGRHGAIAVAAEVYFPKWMKDNKSERWSRR